jgi:hypothetical protein
MPSGSSRVTCPLFLGSIMQITEFQSLSRVSVSNNYRSSENVVEEVGDLQSLYKLKPNIMKVSGVIY